VRAKRIAVGTLLVLGTLFWTGFGLALWVQRQALDSDEWVETSGALLENEAIRNALGVYLVDTLGEFKWLSQRSIERSCDGREEKAAVGSGWPAGDAVTGTSAGGAERAPPAVLGGDRSRPVERGRGGRGGRVGCGWRPVVSGGWRDAVGPPGPAVGALPVVHRAGGDRSSSRA
jgi:hypothetical protein